MMKTSTIQFFKNDKIDKQKWDASINASSNRLIYAMSFYLDSMAHGWNAIAGENYEWVLPLTARKKFGIKYLYQPAFTQQLGIFHKPGVEVPMDEIITWLQKNYSFWEINWNYENRINQINQHIRINPATNFILDLSGSYEGICQHYHKDLIKNLKRSRAFGMEYQHVHDVERLIDLYKEHYHSRMPHLKDVDFQNFKSLCNEAAKRNMLLCREIVNEEGEFLSAAVLLQDGRRIFNIMNTTNAAGRKTEANHLLIDSIIKEFSGLDKVFDFEGSDLPGVKAFYENFGAINQPFFTLKYNNLPWFIKWLKK